MVRLVWDVMWLVARTSELNDVLAVSDRSLKRLASNIENELHSYYSGVTSFYKRKYRALVAGLKDTKSMVLVFVFISSFHELTQLCGVCHPSVCPSVNFCANRFLWLDCDQTCTRWSPEEPASRVCLRSRSRSKITWQGHLWFHENRFFSQAFKTGWIATKIAHGPRKGLHPGCAQGRGQKSRDTDTSVMSRNVAIVRSHVLSTCTHFMKHHYAFLPV